MSIESQDCTFRLSRVTFTICVNIAENVVNGIIRNKMTNDSSYPEIETALFTNAARVLDSKWKQFLRRPMYWSTAVSLSFDAWPELSPHHM